MVSSLVLNDKQFACLFATTNDSNPSVRLLSTEKTLLPTTNVLANGQTKNILKKVDELLEQAGTSKSNLLHASIWVKDIAKDFQDMNAAWIEWIDKDNKPARATVEANMARPAILVEIQVTAVVP